MTKKWASVHPKNRIYKIQFGNLYNPMIDISRLLLYTLFLQQKIEKRLKCPFSIIQLEQSLFYYKNHEL